MIPPHRPARSGPAAPAKIISAIVDADPAASAAPTAEAVGIQSGAEARAAETRAAEAQAAELRARLLGDRLTGTLRTAEALSQANRRIDLTGLDGQAADFCTYLISLPLEQRSGLLPVLDQVLARLDRLQTALADSRRLRAGGKLAAAQDRGPAASGTAGGDAA